MLKKVAYGVICFVVALALGGMIIPSTWMVERSIVIHAPGSKILSLVDNFKTGWPQWSAFDMEDTTIQYVYSGPESGVGASRSWVSTRMGDGDQTITAASPDTGVEFTINMKGTDAPILCKMTFEPFKNGTKVTWTDHGDMGKNPFKKYLALMMDHFLGKSFENSLAMLKEKAELATTQPN